jgi:hypothetical protein
MRRIVLTILSAGDYLSALVLFTITKVLHYIIMTGVLPPGSFAVHREFHLSSHLFIARHGYICARLAIGGDYVTTVKVTCSEGKCTDCFDSTKLIRKLRNNTI